MQIDDLSMLFGPGPAKQFGQGPGSSQDGERGKQERGLSPVENHWSEANYCRSEGTGREGGEKVQKQVLANRG